MMHPRDIATMIWLTGRSFIKVGAIFSLLLLLLAWQTGTGVQALLLGLLLLTGWNAFGQALWAAVSPRMGTFDVRNVLVGRAFILNVFALPLLFALVLALNFGGISHSLAGGLMAMAAAAPLGILAVIAVQDVVVWYRTTPYVLEHKKKDVKC